VYKALNTKNKLNSFLCDVRRSGISEVRNRSESISDDLELPEKQTTRRGPKQEPPGRLSGDFRISKLEKIVGGGGGKKAVSCKTV
jgi:hypothetical protein